MRASLLLTAFVFLSAGAHLGGKIYSPATPVPSTAREFHSAAVPASNVPTAQRSDTATDDRKDPAVFRSLLAGSQEFSGYSHQIVQQLVERRYPLSEACDRILLYCLAKHPSFLKFVRETEQGETFRACLARAVYRMVESTHPEDHGIIVPATVLTELAVQLETLLQIEENESIEIFASQ
jgi:hypothetical protein